MSRWPCVPKPCAGLHAVLVDHAQRPEPHVLRVVVVGERERVIRVEPAVVGVAALGAAAQFDHGHVSSMGSSLPIWRSIMADQVKILGIGGSLRKAS